MTSYTILKRTFKILVHLLLIIICAVTISPLIWVASSSFKTLEELSTSPPTFFPKDLTFEPYLNIWKGTEGSTFAPFYMYTVNSITISLTAAFFVLIISSLAAYGMSRFRFKGTQIVLTIFLLSQMFPGASILIPIVQLIVKLGLYQTRFSLILVYTAFLIPFSTWMLYGYFRTIPRELEEAAFIDGASRFTSLIKIIIPLSIPGIGATFIFSFLGCWNEFLFAMVLGVTDNMRTIPVGINMFIGQFLVYWNDISAAAIIFAIPPLILFILLEKALISGLSAGAMKE